MPATIQVVFDLTQGQWADLHDPTKTPTPDNPRPLRDDVEWLGCDKTTLAVGRLPGGFEAQSAAVILRAQRPDGSVVLIETSLKVFVEAAKVMAGLDASEQQANAAMIKAGAKPPTAT